ncbi:hypothetical protein BKP37_15815 [Anaerobacillus alkalilacustris]|uniref:DUF4007 domain-containing protein n=1 Tax=Anaerobacillus alkalilacustris TaxID=393763 RepID=A0A1S2LFN8_9BACI|nr:DUF4007 family protein [Anaerobacillus alkalilacustris]OIJ11342.1 hypothetical protein BKP37_15815 [Anaerobacillus alkalilacustris]
MGFGQHQSFYLRTYWLRKAIQQLDNNRFFYDKDASELIGLGTNMVKSLKHWIEATEICETDKRNAENKVIHTISPFGEIFNEYDPYIEMNDTISIIHYHIVDNKEPSTTWYWFFNEYEKKSFVKEEAIKDLITWINKNYDSKNSIDTLERDIDCLIKQYYSKSKSDDPEEVIQSPLTALNLIEEIDGRIYKRSPKYENIGLTALMYVLLKYGHSEISIDELETNRNLWGKIFNLQRSEIVKAVEQLVNATKYPLVFDRTNRLDLVRVTLVDPIDFLKEEYVRKERALR